MNSKDFRAELQKIMPNYNWTVHQTKSDSFLEATGIQSAGFNRLSTLAVIRREKPETWYEVKSAGFGLSAPWLKTAHNKTLARALRDLQNSYESIARSYKAHADDLQHGRGSKDNGMASANNEHALCKKIFDLIVSNDDTSIVAEATGHFLDNPVEMDKDVYLKLQTQLERIDDEIAQGRELPDYNTLTTEINRLMEASPWTLHPDHGCVLAADLPGLEAQVDRPGV
jgi:hypothetical protein